MKRDDKIALRDKTVAELQTQLTQLQQELAIARMAVKVNKESDVAKPKRLTNDIAILKTILRDKQNAPDVVQSQSGKKEENKE